jgi:hypothetical protein
LSAASTIRRTSLEGVMNRLSQVAFPTTTWVAPRTPTGPMAFDEAHGS